MFTIEKLLAKVYTAITVLGGVSIALMMIHITSDIVMRYAFNRPLPGTITIVSQYYMLIAIFIPLAYTEKINSHISVELFTDRMPSAIKRHLGSWIHLASSAICFILTGRTWEEALKKMASSASVMQGEYSIITWPSYFILPTGFFLLGTILLLKYIIYAKELTVKET